MRLPNGYGNVTKLPGKRRKPWRVRKTIGWEFDEEGRKATQKFINIGYYAKKEEALAALSEYNKNPYDINASKITFAEVYEKWSEKKYETISKSNINGYQAAYKICQMLYDMKFVDIKLNHLQSVVDKSGKNAPTLKKLKILLSQLYDYAIMHEIVPGERDLVKYIDLSKAKNPNAIDRKPFTKKEIERLWANTGANEYISVILMLIYSGVRIGELLDLKKENVNLNDKWFSVVASKTEAGIRIVPISNKVLDFFTYWYNKNECEYLLSTAEGNHFEYRNYLDSYWSPIIEHLSMSHKPHDTRHTCVSLLTVAGVDERIIKKIVGHKGLGITQSTYTHLEIEELLAEINKI